MIHPETHLCTKEHGPRPAGKPDLCFYCGVPVGTEHKVDCVMRTRSIVVEYTYRLVVTVPESWTPEQFEWHRNEGTWCALNGLDELDQHTDSCLCDSFKAKYISEATEDDEQYWELNFD